MNIYKYFKIPIPEVSGYRWFQTLVLATTLLSILYIAFHLPPLVNIITSGNQKIDYLSTDELTVVNQLLDASPDSSLQINKDKRIEVKRFIRSRYPGLTIAAGQEIDQLILQTPSAALKAILPKTAIRQASFFWLYGDYVFFEIIFWCLFGVLANLLYSSSEYLRKKAFKKEEIYVQIAKLVYSPLCTIIIYISYNQIKTTGSDYIAEFSTYSIVVAFLLGFFSGRMVELLSRLKDVLLPLGRASDQTPVPQAVVQVPEDVIREAIDANDDIWISEYNLEAVGMGKKTVKGVVTDINCLAFKPAIKAKVNEVSKAIPENILFHSKNGQDYYIPTDVQDTGSSIKPSYNSAAPRNTCSAISPKKPGCSVSRISCDDTGTIGLKVYKNGNACLLSCYHVLFAPELQNNILKYDMPDAVSSAPEIISPGKADGGIQRDVLGKVITGILDQFHDIGLASLNETLLLDETVCLLERQPLRVIPVDNSHVGSSYKVQMVGRTSGLQEGRITSAYCSSVINYTINGQRQPKKLKGLISVTRISDAGDSGAPVLDDSGNMIGMLVATADLESFLIPADRIFSELGITLKP